MANRVALGLMINLTLSKQEFTLITKALCRKIREGEEAASAKHLGVELQAGLCLELDEKTKAADHALEKAKEPDSD